MTCSFSVKYCKNEYLDDVTSAIKTWCSKNAESSVVRVNIKRNKNVVDDDCRMIMYVNSIDRSDMPNAMNYISTDLNKTFNMKMVCREQGGGVVFPLLLITVEKPMIQDIQPLFMDYGKFDTVVKTDTTTFLNFHNYKDAKEAYNGSKNGVLIGYLSVRPNAIQQTKMLMQFEQNLLQDKDIYKEKDFMGIQYVEEFVRSYRTKIFFDMKFRTDKDMVEECSKLVVDLYGWVHHKNDLFFSSAAVVEYAKECEDLNNVINVSLKPSFIDVVTKSMVAGASEVALESVVPPVAHVVDLPSTGGCENIKEIHVQQKFENELARLESEFFGQVNTKDIKMNARLVELEECLCLCNDGLDVQERIFLISKSVKKLSKWLDGHETDVKAQS